MMSNIEKELAALRAMSDDEIDTSDIPDCSDLDWDKAEFGKFYRPEMVTELHRSLEAKQEAAQVSGIDKDIKAWFAEHGVSINQVLRQYILHHQS